MRYDGIIEIEKRLLDSNITTISTDQLYQLLFRVSNTIKQDTVKNYAQHLRARGIIRFSAQGTWEIVRKKKPELVKKAYNRDKPIETKQELKQCIDIMKQAKPVTSEKEARCTIERNEAKYAAQKHQIIEVCEQSLHDEKEKERKKNGINILWVDPYEYHVVCDECYSQEPKTHIKGSVPLDDILALHPKKCEYCGESLICCNP